MDIRKLQPGEALKLYRLSFPPPAKAEQFFLELVNGVTGRNDEVDTTIERFSDNWKLNRMSCVDRNILRIAVYEMLHCDSVPAKVSINEAINIGKKYGTHETGSFINGILDSIRISLEKGKNKKDKHTSS